MKLVKEIRNNKSVLRIEDTNLYTINNELYSIRGQFFCCFKTLIESTSFIFAESTDVVIKINKLTLEFEVIA